MRRIGEVIVEKGVEEIRPGLGVDELIYREAHEFTGMKRVN
jgi:hypothetical protein